MTARDGGAVSPPCGNGERTAVNRTPSNVEAAAPWSELERRKRDDTWIRVIALQVVV